MPSPGCWQTRLDLRVRRFTMKDSYTFDMDAAGLDAAYRKHHEAYCRIFDRCGLQYVPVDAHSGAMGGSESCEFMVPSPAGEDWLIECPASGYRANLQKAVTRAKPPAVPDPGHEADPEEFATPGRKTIEEVSEFDGLPSTSHIKALVMVADGDPLMVLLRGDHKLSETSSASCRVRGAQTGSCGRDRAMAGCAEPGTWGRSAPAA